MEYKKRNYKSIYTITIWCRRRNIKYKVILIYKLFLPKKAPKSKLIRHKTHIAIYC